MERFTPYDRPLELAVQQLIRSSYKYKKHLQTQRKYKKETLKNIKDFNFALGFSD
jgi:hypothetical protein